MIPEYRQIDVSTLKYKYLKKCFIRKLFLILTAACLLSGCSREKIFQISGTLTDFGDPDKPTLLYLKTRTVSDFLVDIDSTYPAKDGKFVLKGKSSETDLYYLADHDNVFFLRIFVDPGDKITVAGSAADSQNITIKGSGTQSLYDEYLSLLAPIQEKQKTISQNYHAAEEDASMKDDELQKILKEFDAAYDQLEKDEHVATLDYVSANKNSIIAAYVIYKDTNTSGYSSEIEPKLQLLDPAMNNKFVTMAKNHLAKIKQTEPGAVFPNIELTDLEGRLISIESLRGKYLLVDFWASWCGPCMSEIPNLKQAYQKYHDKGFEIFGISLDEDKEAWVTCIDKHELNWINASELQKFESPVARQLAVKYIPRTFLLDPAGVVIAVDLEEDALENKLAAEYDNNK